MKRPDSIGVNADKDTGPIGRVFKELAAKNQKAFIPFITCGYPDMEGFIRTFELLDRSGADIIEIGIPFSDPLADGPVIQKTSNIAIDNGVNTDVVFDAVKKIRVKIVCSFFHSCLKEVVISKLFIMTSSLYSEAEKPACTEMDR